MKTDAPGNTEPQETPWYVYLLRCADNTLYCGITTDPERRLLEHNHAQSKTRYTRVRQPVALAYIEPSDSRAAASRREYAIKQLNRRQKLQLIASSPYLKI